MNLFRSLSHRIAAHSQTVDARSRQRRIAPLLERTRQPLVASAVLVAFVTTHCVFPLANAFAETKRRANPQPIAASPVRLAQAPPLVEEPEPELGRPKPSFRMGHNRERISLRSLNLTRPPSEKELREGGGMGGAMVPIGNADVEEFAADLDAQLKKFGIAAGIRGQAPVNTPAGRLLQKARERIERLKAINWSYGKALDQRVRGHFEQARDLMRKHLEEYPDSPWAGEAMLHLAIDAQYTGRLGEAQARYKALLDGTEVDINNPKLDPDNPLHSAYDIRQKAKMGWADLDIMMGQWSGALEKLENIIDTDKDWRRQTWARAWQIKVTNLRNQSKKMQACGPEALGAVLVSMGREKDAAQVRELQAPREEGFSLKELAQIGLKHGVAMRGFKAKAADLPKVHLPVIIHFDLSRPASTGRFMPKNLMSEQATAMQMQAVAKLTKKDEAESGTDKTESNAAPTKVVANCEICPPVAMVNAAGKLSPTLPGTSANEGDRSIAVSGVPYAMCPGISPATKTSAPKTGAGALKVVRNDNMLHGVPSLCPELSREYGRTASTDSAFKVSSIGHFLIVEKVDAAAQVAYLFDPLENNRHTISFADLDREWSGYGLTAVSVTSKQMLVAGNFAPEASAGKRQSAQKTEQIPLISPVNLAGRIAWLSPEQMSHIFGGCCCSLGAPGDNGPGPENGAPGGPGGNNPCGAPTFSINRVSLNMYVHDVPMWYSPPVGPQVSIGMHYNSHSSINLSGAFGNKWMFNYASYLIENPDGSVYMFQPDSRQMLYLPLAGGTGDYMSMPQDLNRLHKVGTDHFELKTPTDEVYVYQKPGSNPVLAAAVPTLTEVRDRFGNSINFSFDGDGRMTTITDAQGKETKLFYDNDDFPLAITRAKDPFGRQAKFEYDESGNLIRVTDMQGDQVNYTYTNYAWMTDMETTSGNWHFLTEPGYFVYNDNTKLINSKVTITDPLNHNEEYAWQSEVSGTGYVAYKNKRGYSTIYRSAQTVGSAGKITQIVEPGGGTTNITYDFISGLPKTIQDVKGRTSSITYNTIGRATSVTDAKGRVTTYTYDTNGVDLLSATNPRGERVAELTYNNRHQPLTATVDPDNLQNLQATTTYTYKSWGAPESVTDANSQVTSYTYDNSSKRLTTVSHQSTTQASYTYDRMGRIRTATDAAGLTLTYDYNDLNRLVRITLPNGTYVEKEASCCGISSATSDRAGRLNYTDYNPLKQPVRAQDPAGNTVSLEYDPNGNLTQIQDAKGNATTFYYDALDRLVRKAYANNTSESYAYDIASNVIATRDTRGILTTYNYDADTDDVTGIGHPNSPDISFSYNDLGQLATMHDGIGTTTYGYDLLGRQTSVDGPFSNDTVAYDYDLAGRPTTLQINNTDQTSYSYDTLGRLEGVSGPAGYFYHAYVGNTSQLTWLQRPNNTTSSYGYDGIGRLAVALSQKSNSDNISEYRYGFDPSNQPQRDVRTSMEQTLGSNPMQHINYSYDDANQLTGAVSTETPTPQIDESFTYDAMGNRLTSLEHGGWNSGHPSGSTTTYTHNGLNQLTGLASTNSSNQTTSDWYGYWGGSNSDVGRGAVGYTHYDWDDSDQLYQVIKKDPATGANLTRATFIQDGWGRVVISREYAWIANAWSLTSEKRRIYDGMDVIQERDASNNVIVNYTREGNIGGILGKTVKGQGGNPDQHFYFHYDGTGNVTQLTDVNQNVVAEYTYDAFGNVLTSTGVQASSNFYRFSSKEISSISGLYNYGYRFYSPNLGRWISRDPLSEKGGLNLYSFGPNSPINGYDPYGLDWVLDTSNFFAGWGDTLTFGATGWVRYQLGVNDVVDECSGWYKGGQWVGTAHSLAFGAAGALESGAQGAGAGLRTFRTGAGAVEELGPVSIRQLRMALGRAGLGTKEYRIMAAAEEELVGLPSGVTGWMTSHGGEVVRDLRGRPIIKITPEGLKTMQEAVKTVGHEIEHVKDVLRGNLPDELRAIAAEQKYWEQFLRGGGGG